MKNKLTFILPLLLLCCPLFADIARNPERDFLLQNKEGLLYILIFFVFSHIAIASFLVIGFVLIYESLMKKKCKKIKKGLSIILILSILISIFTVGIGTYRYYRYTEEHKNDPLPARYYPRRLDPPSIHDDLDPDPELLE